MAAIVDSDYIILVTGVPGTGKTTVGSLLSKDLSCHFHSSSTLLRSLGLVEEDPSGRDTSIIREDAINVAARLLPRGCHIIETLYPDLWVNTLHDRIPLIVYLRTHPLELCARLRKRGWRDAKIMENCAAEALNTLNDYLYEYSDMTIEVDTTRASPGDTVDHVWHMLHSWSVGLAIDWLQIDPSLLEHVSRWLASIDAHGYGKPY